MGRASTPRFATIPNEQRSSNFSAARRAKSDVYRNGATKGSRDMAEAPVLLPGYTKHAQQFAERRFVPAGYRLARLLKNAAQ